jgi:hypothetical protein
VKERRRKADVMIVEIVTRRRAGVEIGKKMTVEIGEGEETAIEEATTMEIISDLTHHLKNMKWLLALWQQLLLWVEALMFIVFSQVFNLCLWLKQQKLIGNFMSEIFLVGLLNAC